MKAEKYIARLSRESLEDWEFCVNPVNPTTTIKKRENKKVQEALFQCLNSEKVSLMLT